MPFIRIFYFEKKEKSCSYQPNDLCFTFLLDINDEKKKVGIMFLPFSTSIFSLFLLPLSPSLYTRSICHSNLQRQAATRD
jgi:hypothetical protein